MMLEPHDVAALASRQAMVVRSLCCPPSALVIALSSPPWPPRAVGWASCGTPTVAAGDVDVAAPWTGARKVVIPVSLSEPAPRRLSVAYSWQPEPPPSAAMSRPPRARSRSRRAAPRPTSGDRACRSLGSGTRRAGAMSACDVGRSRVARGGRRRRGGVDVADERLHRVARPRRRRAWRWATRCVEDLARQGRDRHGAADAGRACDGARRRCPTGSLRAARSPVSSSELHVGPCASLPARTPRASPSTVLRAPGSQPVESVEVDVTHVVRREAPPSGGIRPHRHLGTRCRRPPRLVVGRRDADRGRDALGPRG